jgi:hypothetical protein
LKRRYTGKAGGSRKTLKGRFAADQLSEQPDARVEGF